MQSVNNLISKSPVHLTSNTIILIILAIIAFYVVSKVIGVIFKVVMIVVACWFVLMCFQSTNIVNIPVIKQTYTKIEQMIPSKVLWTKAALDGADKIKNAVSNIK
ncbi:hypothetical protein [Clostridium akagii]|uniref:hypothetical protein n=1 Tax=Clostridium akagii TaxID=91623 RepID=UPI00047E71DE|nr:hypothetical protein [Clostridium akagii]